VILRPHPRKQELGAWFDGEGRDRVGAHVLGCNRCQRYVSELSRLRSWLRVQPFVAMTDQPDETAAVPAGRGRRPLVLVAALLTAFVLVAERAEAPIPLQASSPTTTTTRPSTTVAEAPSTAPADVDGSSELTATTPSTSTAPSTNSVSSQALARAREPSSPKPLRLGLIVPTTGTMAAEGKDVVAVVRQRVASANAAGGVAGLPVELEVAAAESAEAVAALVKRVDALVGGFGAEPPPGLPWLLPADPGIAGPSVLPAEMTSRMAGAQLGTVLRSQGINGPVGVVVGSGPDAALGAGLASKTQIIPVVAQETGTCALEIAALRRAGAVALAVAGNPELAAKCLRAAFAAAWLPAFGRILAPSAAYAGLQIMPEALGARTVLGLPWPTSTAPGAARFRATTESTSYRALVSYAATELAIDVARQQGVVSVESVHSGTWRTDLVDLSGLTNRVNTLVSAFLGTWLIAG
jgi:ABC-type branched-subunit amino acid transport system substrate-binding protein